jgi:hypothetical protein
MSSGCRLARPMSGVVVGVEVMEDDAGDAAFEAAQGFPTRQGSAPHRRGGFAKSWPNAKLDSTSGRKSSARSVRQRRFVLRKRACVRDPKRPLRVSMSVSSVRHYPRRPTAPDPTRTRLWTTLHYTTAPSTLSFAGVNREQPAFFQCVCDCPSLVVG